MLSSMGVVWLIAGMMTGAIVGGKSVEQAARLQSESTSVYPHLG
jgi:ABC-type iron transport system FetAB permease component